MRAIRARYDPYLQTRHRVEQVNFYSARGIHCGCDENNANVFNCLNWWAERVVISSTQSSWRPVSNDKTQWSILGPIVFNLCVNGVHVGTAHCQQVCR